MFKNWLKQQVTELTAWAGLYVIFTGFFNLPFWFDLLIGILLISIDDTKAATFIKAKVPWLHRKIDEAYDGR